MEFETIELTKDVLIFKNVLKDKERVQKFLTKAREDGYVDPFFNIWTQYREKISYYKSDPRHMPEYKTSNEYSAEFMRECIDIFFKCLKIYKEKIHFLQQSMLVLLILVNKQFHLLLLI